MYKNTNYTEIVKHNVTLFKHLPSAHHEDYTLFKNVCSCGWASTSFAWYEASKQRSDHVDQIYGYNEVVVYDYV